MREISLLPTHISGEIMRNAAAADTEMRFPAEAFVALGEGGFFSWFLDGEGAQFNEGNFSRQLHFLLEVGRADLSVGRIYEGHLNALYLVNVYGSEEQKLKYNEAAKSRCLFGVWNTQAENGVRMQRRENGKVMLFGSKTFCSGSSNLDYALITADLENEGWQMCIVPLKEKTPAVDNSFWDPMGMRATTSNRVDFEGIEIDAEDLLGSPGDYYRQPLFGGGAMRFCAVQLGGAKAIVESTSEYLIKLGRTEDPFQRARVAEMSVLLTSGLQWVTAAGQIMKDSTRNEVETSAVLNFAHMMRTAVAEICGRILDLSEKCVGARGLMKPGRLERLHRDLRYYLRQPGPDAALQAIGEFVLKEYKDGRTSE